MLLELGAQLLRLTDAVGQLTGDGMGGLSQEQLEITELIAEAVGQFEQQVAGLDLSQGQSTAASASEPVDVGELCAGLVQQQRRLARGSAAGEQGQPALTVDVPQDLPRLRVDPVKLRRIVDNLLVNAIKFTDEGRVTLQLRERAGCLELSIADTGCGIPPADLARVFETFYQAGGGSRPPSGRGLGLTICRQLVESLQGTIAAESSEGHGSRFTVCFPPHLLVGGATRRRAAACEDQGSTLTRQQPRELSTALDYAGISHDLRSPLCATIGLAEVMRSGLSGPLGSPQRELVQRILDSGRALLRQIDRLLDEAQAVLEQGRGIL